MPDFTSDTPVTDLRRMADNIDVCRRVPAPRVQQMAAEILRRRAATKETR